MKETKKQKQYRMIAKHGEDLKNIFHLKIDGVKLCKDLRRLEIRLNSMALSYCNGDMSMEDINTLSVAYMDKVDRILEYKRQAIPVIFNRDPRGYALKIDDEYVSTNSLRLYRDMGGYGIIAPEITGE